MHMRKLFGIHTNEKDFILKWLACLLCVHFLLNCCYSLQYFLSSPYVSYRIGFCFKYFTALYYFTLISKNSIRKWKEKTEQNKAKSRRSVDKFNDWIFIYTNLVWGFSSSQFRLAVKSLLLNSHFLNGRLHLFNRLEYTYTCTYVCEHSVAQAKVEIQSINRYLYGDIVLLNCFWLCCCFRCCFARSLYCYCRI